MNKAMELLRGLVSEIERQTCEHEETHRGGAIWEICDSCGAKWADDEGGKPEFEWPESVEKAREFLAAHPAVEQAGGDERDLQAEGAQGELLPCPFCGGQAHLTYDDYVHDDLRPMPVVECNACHTWVRAESWNKRAALAQPSPKCATCNGSGQVWISDEPQRHFEDCPDCAQPSLAPTEGFSHFPELLESVQQMDAMLKAEAERPEVVGYRVSIPDEPELGHWLEEEDESEPQIQHHEPLMSVAQHDASVARWAEMLNRVEQERDAAMARVAELEAKLSDPTAVHQWQFSNAWFDGSEEVVLKAGKEGSPIRTLYTAPVAQAQPEETPGEILAAKLIETWVAKHGKPAPWSKIVEITALATNMPNDERDRLLALDDDVDAQAQHSVPIAPEFKRALGLVVAALEADGDRPTSKYALSELKKVLAAAPGTEVPQAWLDVQAERRRQVEAEGWTPEHDDLYCAAELPRAAAAYILSGANDEAPAIWPFLAKWWKPRDARANYMRAGALILAEIERLDRAAAPGKEGV
ncbi:hypothetical protein [Pseudomonas aeruginosa]|nr:hypothetical protein [Pseudomonas aeruginosa]